MIFKIQYSLIILALTGILTAQASLPMNKANSDFENTWDIAQTTLQHNIVELPSGPYLRAGGTHFASLWTRDFAWSARGLLAIGRADVVKNHIEALLLHKNEDHLLPRVLDSIPSWRRVLFGIITGREGRSLRDPLRSEHLGEHSTVAIDSNLLTLMAAIQYLEYENSDTALQWWWEHLSSWQDLYFYYDSQKENGFITQEKYGDWQDSVDRSGVSFLTNLLYWHVSDKIINSIGPEDAQRYFQIDQKKQDALLVKLWRNFWDNGHGLFRSHLELELISLDGNLLAIQNTNFIKRLTELNLVANNSPEFARQEIYENLKDSPLWSSWELPGVASYPDYPRSWRSLTTRIVGLSHYHDRMLWTWLIGMSLEVSVLMEDTEEAQRIIRQLNQRLKRDGVVTEIYSPREDLPAFRSLLYRSEQPFSWGAAVILQGLETFEQTGLYTP